VTSTHSLPPLPDRGAVAAEPADLAERLAAAREALRSGGHVVVTDRIRDIGVVGIAGSRTTASNVNFLIQHCRGIVYAGATREHLDRIGIGHQHGTDVLRSKVYVAVDSVMDVTTGVSAADRAATIRAVIDPATTRSQLRTPGHVLPTVIDTSGSIENFYLNEALHYLNSTAGLGTGLALSAVLAPDGSMATVAQLNDFAERHGITCLDLTELLRARRRAEGWTEAWPGQRAFDLTQLRTQVAITALGAHEWHDEYLIELLPFCMVGHALRAPSPCRDRLEAALASVERRGAGAVVLAWPSTRRGGDTHTAHPAEHEDHHVNPALAWLVAAELAAAVPSPPPCLSKSTTREQQ
jgi:3,4-dihydroxy 2-butanone 4-phosphate synthase/GTP cyclohydrolase II